MDKTRQFQVNQPCPKDETKGDFPPFPFCIWVFVPPLTLAQRKRPMCLGTAYLCDESQPAVSSAGKIYDWRKAESGTMRVVCEHMGHLIE